MLDYDELYYRLGRIKISGSDIVKRRLCRDGELTREKVIEWAKGALSPLLPIGKNLFREDTWNIEDGAGVSEKHLMWSHFWSYRKWLCEHQQRQHDILVIFECSNRKPYSAAAIPGVLYGERYSHFVDVCACHAGPVSYEYSHHYPARFDEWRHNLEKPSIRYKYMMVTGHRFLRYVKALGYKDVLVCMQNRNAQIIFDKLVEKNVCGCRDWLHIMTTEKLRQEFLAAYPQMGNGIAILRFLPSSWVQNRFHTELGKLLEKNHELVGDKKDEWDALSEALSIEDPKKRQKAIKQYKKTYHIKPYDVMAGVDTQIDPIDPRDAIIPELYEQFKVYVERVKQGKGDCKKVREMYPSRHLFGVLDLLLDYYDAGELDSYGERFFTDCKDCDVEYWNMYAAVNDVLESDPDWEHIKNDRGVWYHVGAAKNIKRDEDGMLALSDSITLTSQYVTMDWLVDHPARLPKNPPKKIL